MIVSLLVGIVVTLVASLRPAVRATRVPPIAAVREGSTLPPSRFARFRTPGSLIVTALGFAAVIYGLFSVQLFGKHLGTTGVLVWMGLGALLVFIGVSLVSVRFVRPLAWSIGPPDQVAADRPLARLPVPHPDRLDLPGLLPPPVQDLADVHRSLVGRRARPRQRAAKPAAHRVDRRRAHDRPRARDHGLTARLGHPRLVHDRGRQDLDERRLRDHRAEQLRPDPDRGGERCREGARRRSSRQRPYRRRARLQQELLRHGRQPGRRHDVQARVEGRLAGRLLATRRRRRVRGRRLRQEAQAAPRIADHGDVLERRQENLRDQRRLQPTHGGLAVRDGHDLPGRLGQAATRIRRISTRSCA